MLAKNLYYVRKSVTTSREFRSVEKFCLVESRLNSGTGAKVEYRNVYLTWVIGIVYFQVKYDLPTQNVFSWKFNYF